MALAWLFAASSAGCSSPAVPPELHGQVKLTLLHTADIHSRLFPYALQISQTDAALGLGAAGNVVEVGGVARVAYVLDQQRAQADRVMHLDSGDGFQGAPVFNFYNGEAEVRSLSMMGTDAQVIGNHEFDKGTLNIRNQYEAWATFPLLGANYFVNDPTSAGAPGLDNILKPFTVINVRGLKVGVVGMGNLSSLASLFQQPSPLGVTPLNTIDTAQAYIDLLRPMVDVIVFVTHLGFNADEAMIQGTTGIDVVLGGHNHIVLQPSKVIDDCASYDPVKKRHYITLAGPDGSGSVRRYCSPRPVILQHSGAFAKYVGRLDLVLSNDPNDLPPRCNAAHPVDPCYDPINGFEVISHSYKLFPITADVPQNRAMDAMLQQYQQGLDELTDLDLLVGYAPNGSARFGTSGGDSPLGNMIATAMRQRLGIQTDFSLTNTTGIRADMVPGPVTIDQMYDIFPFDNAITKMQLSGEEVQEMFDFVARRSAGRGCVSQAQIAGARVVLDCDGCQRDKGPEPSCVDNSDCASDECNGGKCVPQPCADDIYIGATSHPCKTDADCVGTNKQQQPNSCDTSRPDANGYGRCLAPINLLQSYDFATSDYLAGGGSGFTVLKRNTTQLDTHIQQRDALIDWIRGGKPCGYSADNKTSDGLKACNTDADCPTDSVCACPEAVTQDSNGTCKTSGTCGDDGRCVLSQCRQDVADYHRNFCASPESAKEIVTCSSKTTACQQGGEECKFLACIDNSVGNFADNRVLMVGR
jgi:5'-nucleotidase / UDP-sugar diphosphatase